MGTIYFISFLFRKREKKARKFLPPSPTGRDVPFVQKNTPEKNFLHIFYLP